MRIIERTLPGVFEIIPETHEDERGFFMRTYDKEIFKRNEIDRNWVQESHSRSMRQGIIRGLHFQLPPYAETKLVRCVRGSVYDVFADLREDSATFGQWGSLVLSEDDHNMVFIPRGFAHGFCTLTEISEVIYKMDFAYNAKAYSGIIWNDPDLNIQWPVKQPIVSKKDARLQTFSEFRKKYAGF